MWSLAMYSNYFIIHYRWMLHGSTIKVVYFMVLFNTVSLHYKQWLHLVLYIFAMPYYTYQSLLHYWTNYMNVWPKYILLRQHILHTLFFWSTDWVLLVTAFVPFLLNNPKSSTRWWENVHGESSWGLFFTIAISSLVSLSSNSLPLIISMLMKMITSVYLGI